MSNLSRTFKRKTFLAKTIAVLTTAALVQNALALPQSLDFNAVNGNSTYSINGAQSTLTISQDNRVVEFSGAGINVANGETLSFNHESGTANWSVLARDVSGNASSLNGLLNGNVRVFLVNQNGIVFGSGAQVDLANLVASTHAIDSNDFTNGNLRFTSNGSNASISIDGLASNSVGAQIALVSGDINVDGDINVASGDLNLVSGNEVVVSFDNNNLMQFDISEALGTNIGDRVIDVAASAEVSARNVNIQAVVTDPKSYAINNRGIVRATGIDTSTPGVIRLIGTGGKIASSGSLDASVTNGSIEASAGRILLAGNVDVGTGTVSATIGDGVSDLEGRFEVFENSTAAMSSLSITGVGDVNRVYGLANYRVIGRNEGTASYSGIGSTAWENTGAVTFTNVQYLQSTSQVQNSIELLEGAAIGTIIGGAASDTFTIAGSVEVLKGLGGFDTFNMTGGNVSNRIDGNADGDTINGVFNPQGTIQDGSSDFIASWTRISEINEAAIPPVIIDPIDSVDPEGLFLGLGPSILAPNSPTPDLNTNSSASLGLVSNDNTLNLPCGYSQGRDISAAEDCEDPELQQLISSLIHFDSDSHLITAASANRLDRVSAYVIDSDRFDKVVISGHTDDHASIAYNLKLSKKRAIAAADYMQGQGVAADMFEIHAFGESLPARLNDSNENRAFNRRAHIELKR